MNTCYPSRRAASPVVSAMMLWAALCGSGEPVEAEQAQAQSCIQINGRTGASETGGEIPLAEGELLCVEITETDPSCYHYNLKSVAPPPPTEALAPGLPHLVTVKLKATHSRKFASYHVEITKKSGAPATCTEPPGPWDIAVRTVGWAVGFAPAFTVDSLVDEAFTLVESTRTVDGESVQGYVPVRVRGAESDYRMGAAAFAHLYFDDPRASNWRAHWAPLSFGLGFSSGSEARYFLGTTLRFGDSFFVTGGAVFGARASLPAALAIDDPFTEDANALTNPYSKTEVAAFVAISLKLGSVDLGSKFAGAFSGTPEP